MKTMKPKSIFALILFSILTFGSASIATSAGTRITNNGFEDSFPKTAGGYVVWQGQDGNDWEIFLYNANNGSGPTPITDNTYPDINPETDGRYVTWQAGAALHGEIFLYDIETQVTTPITDDVRLDLSPKIVDGLVVWVSHSVGLDTLIGPGDIFLYNTADGSLENISKLVDPNNDHDDYSFRFDGNRIQWVQRTLGDMPNYVYDPDAISWIPMNNSDMRNYVYDLATGSMKRYYIPEDDDLEIIAPYYVEDLTTANTLRYETTEIPAVRVDPQSDGDFSVSATLISGSDREILLSDRQFKRGGRLTNNDIEDTQPVIKDNIVVWKGGEGNNSEIYLYEIEPLFADAGYDFKMDFASVDSTVIRGGAGGGANQYRWLLGGTGLTEWLPVVDGQAHLSLADKSGFVLGPQTLTLEVTDGITHAIDKVTMDLIVPPLTLVSPADGIEFTIRDFIRETPVFVWDSSYIKFKIEFSAVASFEGQHTLAFPESDDAWLNKPSITLDKNQVSKIIGLMENEEAGPNYYLYWRVLAQDSSGNMEITEARHVVVFGGK